MRGGVVAGVIVIWLALVVVGMASQARYASDSGEPGSPPSSWPAASPVERSADKPTLVMTVHPHCACSRASVGELARIASVAQGRAKIVVLFALPEGVSQGWADTDLWQAAANIPDVDLVQDYGGRIARLFGARTSGDTAYYDRSGRLTFAGGITSERGHAGDSIGGSAILANILDGGAEVADGPVFGCPLQEAEPKCAQGGSSCPQA